jgi:hypothetical protein
VPASVLLLLLLLLYLQGVRMSGRQAIIYGAGGFIDDYATEEEYR